LRTYSRASSLPALIGTRSRNRQSPATTKAPVQVQVFRGVNERVHSVLGQGSSQT
jgi:hypothetical protein